MLVAYLMDKQNCMHPYIVFFKKHLLGGGKSVERGHAGSKIKKNLRMGALVGKSPLQRCFKMILFSHWEFKCIIKASILESDT